MTSRSITLFGPSPQLEHLHAFAASAADWVRRTWAYARGLLSRTRTFTRHLATTALGLLASESGYDLTRATLTTGARLLGRGVTAITRIAGRAVVAANSWIVRGIAWASPALAQRLRRTASTAVVRLERMTSALSARVGDGFDALAALTDTTLVRTATTRAAQIGAATVAVHALTQGAVAARLVTALPWTMDAVLWITNPALAMVLVGGVFAVSLSLAALRLATAPSVPSPVSPARSVAEQVEPTVVDLTAIAAQLTIDVTPDGSLVVHGIPTDLPDPISERVASIAADAATERLRAILTHRPHPNRDDRRAMTRAARAAVRRAC